MACHPALGVTQILAWGSSYYLPAIMAGPISADTGWSLTGVVGGLSAIAHRGERPVLAWSAALLAAGLCAIGAAPSLPAFVAGWMIMSRMAAGSTTPPSRHLAVLRCLTSKSWSIRPSRWSMGPW